MADFGFDCKSARELYEEEHGKREFLSTGDDDLDFLIGIRFGAITEISGEAGCGKTQFCMQLCARSLVAGRRVLYVDTENGSAIKRTMKFVAGFKKTHEHTVSDEEIGTNLLYTRPNTIGELLIRLEQCASSSTRPDLLILDSITCPFRGENLPDVVCDLDAAAITLCRLAGEHRVAVVCTNHVTTKIDADGNWHLNPSLGFYWSHRPTVRIWMQRNESRRFIQLSKCPWGKRKNWEFKITEGGICLLGAEYIRL